MENINLFIEERRKEKRSRIEDSSRSKLRQRAREYYYNNKKKVKEIQKKWRQRSEEKIQAKQKEYYKKNADRIKQQKKEYREKNSNKIKEYKKNYLEKNREKINEKKREYYHRNKQKKILQGPTGINIIDETEFKFLNRKRYEDYQKEYCEFCCEYIPKSRMRQHKKTKGHIFNCSPNRSEFI